MKSSSPAFVLFLVALWLTAVATSMQAQTLTQTIRGTVVDSESRFPLPGVNVVLLTDDAGSFKGASTDAEGHFSIEGVPLGRQAVRCSYTGYQDIFLNNIIVTSAKEVVLQLEMTEAVQQLQDIEIRSTRSGEVSNEMAVVSARQFSVDETDRYPGSRGDPSRMASNFAGVQGADDSRNDIVIRGNSPSGVLWQVEGIAVPNPNHFNIPGTAGGSVNILNNKVLANSDFYTGAFPAEFGNGIAGVFDIRFRPGNNQQHEFTAQVGLMGVEFSAEGPLLNESGASFVAAYRYSTLGIFQALNIDIGVDAVPNYQDLNFHLKFPLSKGGSWSVWGLGGSSKVDIILSDKLGSRNIYGATDRDQYFWSSMGVIGTSYTKPISKDAFFKMTLAASRESVDAEHDLILTKDSLLEGAYTQVLDRLAPILDYTFRTAKFSVHPLMYRKLNSRNTLNYGVQADWYHFNLIDSAVNLTSPIDFDVWETRWDVQDQSLLLQPYVQLRHKASERLELTAGIHAQYFSLSNSLSVAEPRLGLKYQLNNRSNLSLGAGIHSQIQQPYLYFYSDSLDSRNELVLYNKDMNFTYSAHLVGGYEKLLAGNTRMKLETYYQRLWNIPVDMVPTSFSLINQGTGFSRFFPEELVNAGTGFNYGIEATLERFFSNQFFFLLTGALFESKYRGSDGVLRDTDFNGNFAFSGLSAYEFQLSSNNSLTLGMSVTWVGGRRTGPVDTEISALTGELEYIDALRNSEQFPAYFRPDLRFSYKANRPKVTHEVALDLTNFIGRQNILTKSYANIPPDYYRIDYQLGFFPVFYYKLDF